MIFDTGKASKNMLLSATQLDRMYHEQQAEIYNEQQNKIIAEQAAEQREQMEYFNYLEQYNKERFASGIARSERMTKIKEAFLSECIYKLYCESAPFPLSSRDKVIARNLVNKFVIENGAGNLIQNFATTNMILSEFSRISQKYYDRVLEAGCDKHEECEFTGQIGGQILDQRTVDDFYKELSDVDVSDASKAIKDRVADAISNFIDTNSVNKLEYEEIIKTAQDKVAAINGDDALAESYITLAKRKINELKNSRENNVLGHMVESLTTAVFKDEALKARYINEGAVDMEGIVESAELIYTMLEMVNTTNMVNVNEEFVSAYLTNL